MSDVTDTRALAKANAQLAANAFAHPQRYQPTDFSWGDMTPREKHVSALVARAVATLLVTNTERCGDSSVWKGCARIKDHDGGGCSTYPLTAVDKIAAALRASTPSAPEGDQQP